VPSPQIATSDKPSLVMLHLSSTGGEISLNQESRLKGGFQGTPGLRRNPFMLNSKAAKWYKDPGGPGAVRQNGAALNPPLTKLVQISSMDSLWSAI
jgi:hypothetical protein